MTDPTVILTFPKARCKEVEVKGEPFIAIDTDMTADDLIMMLLKWSASDDHVGVVMRREEKE